MTSGKKLVLIGNFAPDGQESMQRFAQILIEGFSARGRRVETWKPAPHFARLAGAYRYGGFPKYLGYLDKFFVFPNSIRRQRRGEKANTVYHIVDHSNAVYAPHFRGAPLVVTCHDLLQVRSARGEFPQNRISSSGQRYQEWILKHLRRLKTVVCISQKTRADLMRLAGLSAEATPIVHMGLNYPYRPMPSTEAWKTLGDYFRRVKLPRSYLEDSATGFLLGVGGAHWYKNRRGLIDIFIRLQKHSGVPNRLVYVGPPLEPELEMSLSQAGMRGAAVRLSGVSNEELRAAYSAARGLLFPSWEEGFGWPIAEAQACGCPVFTSDRPPMTEIGGDAACYIDPSAPEEAAQQIAQALLKAPEMKSAGQVQAARWSTERMILGYEEQYVRAAQESSSSAAVTG